MKKAITILAATVSVVASTAAHAETRPAATEYYAPMVADAQDDEEEAGVPQRLWLLILLGVGGLAGIFAAAASHQGNSPR